MSERGVEQYLVRRVKQAGGQALKFVSPGNVGVPDRIVLLPDGVVFFVELKSEGGVLSTRQKYVHGRIRRLGADVYVPHSKREVDAVLRRYVNNYSGGDN